MRCPNAQISIKLTDTVQHMGIRIIIEPSLPSAHPDSILYFS
jgi:hypothetical protein